MLTAELHQLTTLQNSKHIAASSLAEKVATALLTKWEQITIFINLRLSLVSN